VPRGERLVDDLADAILDGTPIDWAVVESSSEGTARPLVKHLRVLAAVADLHRDAPPSLSTPSQAPQSPLEPNVADAPELWGHLRLIERIGRGAFGHVYRAWDTRLDREVALKLLPAGPSFGDRAASAIIHEGRLLARVRHPNVVTIYGAEQIADQIGLWMEFVRGRTLEQVLDQQKVVSAAEAVDIGLELCRAMSAVHGAGLLHRDIKAHNVMRADDGRIVLMDFGTGRELEGDASSDLAGTPLYLAPEVLQRQKATVRSDIYSLGVLLYHLVTGSYPVHARTVREIRRAHERGERTAIQTARSDAPSKLSRVIERAIDPDPARRYETADAVAADLAALQPRPRIVRLAYAAGVAVASLLVAGVVWEAAGRRVGSSRTPSALLAAFAGLNRAGGVNVSPAERPIIAVLPLQNLSAEPDSDYFVDGLTDEIIRNLAAIKGLEVRSRTSSFAFKDKRRNLREVGQQLGVNLVVEGSIMRSGSKLRINAQLVRVADDVPVWTERYDRELKDIFAIQDEISRAIVNKLRLTLGRGQRRYDTSFEAYEAYLRGRYFWNQRSAEGLRKAIEHFQAAVRLDPGYADAYAGIAGSYGPLGYFGYVPPNEALAGMRAAVTRALAIDDDLAEAHAARAILLAFHEWRLADAEPAFRRALALDPGDATAHSWYAQYLSAMGRRDEALAESRRAIELDPLSLWINTALGSRLYWARRFDEAIAQCRKTLELDPAYGGARRCLAFAYAQRGAQEQAVRELERDGSGRAQPLVVLADLGYVYARAGRSNDAHRVITELTNRSAREYVTPYALALVHAGLGENDRALEWLERAGEERSPRLVFLSVEPAFDGLRGDPRFAAFRRKLGLP
jgi:TolB-like protein/Flp pilus assembly protein TadD/tRNA A-37 threonylcarbamoyl transferase component Bud32